MIVNAFRTAMASLPIEEPGVGRKHALMLSTADLFMRWAVPTSFATGLGQLTIDPRHDPERSLAYFFNNYIRYHARSDLGKLIATLTPGDGFVDVGSNLGAYSYISHLHGLRTYPVEPEPRFASFLARNADLFGKVSAVALSDQTGELPLYYTAGNTGAQSLLASDGAMRSADSVTVETFSRLAVSGAFGDVRAIRLIKIDVEGFEAQVVSGMSDFLLEHRPLIWCEVRGAGAKRATNSVREVTELMRANGYEPASKFDPEDIVFDVLYAPRGRVT